MFVVKDDNPDVSYQITAPEVTDAEGNQVEGAELSYEVTSDAPDIVAITQDANDQTKGTVSFGRPGTTSVTATVKNGEKVLGVFGAQFHVTAGDPTQITGGSFNFNGLTSDRD